MNGITGYLKVKFETQNITDKFSKREFVIETDEQYPQCLQLELQNNMVDVLDEFELGESILCKINIRGRMWLNNNNEEKYFNTLVCYQISRQE